MKKNVFNGLLFFMLMFFMTSCGESYNGDVKHDAKLMHEKLYKERKLPEEVFSEYEDYIIKNRLGMPRYKEVLDELSNID